MLSVLEVTQHHQHVRTFAQERVAVFEMQPLVLRHDCFRISQIVQQECVHVSSQLGGMGGRRGKHVAGGRDTGDTVVSQKSSQNG